VPPVPDFRTLAFGLSPIDASGMALGRTEYRKLYAIENLLRVVIHSVLTVQIGPRWWDFAVGRKLRQKVEEVQADYVSAFGRAPAGRHALYYTFLLDLNKIITATSNQFTPIIPDIDKWMVRIERLRLPRNIVGHVNWPSPADRRLIQETYADVKTLVGEVTRAGVPMLIP
jgi:hypothetical protein